MLGTLGAHLLDRHLEKWPTWLVADACALIAGFILIFSDPVQGGLMTQPTSAATALVLAGGALLLGVSHLLTSASGTQGYRVACSRTVSTASGDGPSWRHTPRHNAAASMSRPSRLRPMALSSSPKHWRPSHLPCSALGDKRSGVSLGVRRIAIARNLGIYDDRPGGDCQWRCRPAHAGGDFRGSGLYRHAIPLL